MSNELPKGWATAALSQLTENPKQDIVSGPFGSNLKSDEYVSEGVPIIRLQNVDRNKFLEKNMRFITPQKARELSAHNFRAGDVVISKLGDPLGKACAIPESLPHGIVVADVVRVRIDESRFSRSYALFAINSPAVANQINSEMMGSTRPRVNLNNIRDLQIPLAPLVEQRRIVAKVEKLLGQVDACQQRLEKMPTLLKRFRQSILAAACSGRLTADWREENDIEVEDGDSVKVPDSFPSLPETWRWKLLESVCEKIVDCPHSTPKWAESGRLCVRTTNFKPGFLDLSVVRYVSATTFNERIERLRPKPGDILYSREGGILGIACMIPPKVELCLGQRMMLFRTKSDFSAALLMHWLNSRVILGRVQELTGGSASPHLNVRDIKSFPTPIAPLAEQQEIVRRVAGLFALADQLEVRLAKARGQVDALTPSLLARAFAGKLVPQDPTDEPAEKLLRRIKTGRNDQRNGGNHGA